jgi:ABC-2 type transport system permease protein
MTAPTPSVATPTVSEASRSYGASTLGALATLYALSVRQYLHGKRWMVMGVAFLVPAALALIVRASANDAPLIVMEFLLAMMFIPQLLLPLLGLLYASGLIQDEQEEQTLTYLLVRPLPKWGIYIVKWLATVTTTVVITVIATVVTYAAIYVGADSAPDDLIKRCAIAAGVHALAVAAYCSLFGLLGLVTKRTLVMGIVYCAVVEGLLANLPFGIRLLTVIYYTRLVIYRTVPFLFEEGDRLTDITGEAWQLGLRDDPKLLQHPDMSTCFLVLIVGSFVCTAVAAFLCTRREFHVKTPEKA